MAHDIFSSRPSALKPPALRTRALFPLVWRGPDSGEAVDGPRSAAQTGQPGS